MSLTEASECVAQAMSMILQIDPSLCGDDWSLTFGDEDGDFFRMYSLLLITTIN